MRSLTYTMLVSITSLWLVGCATNSDTMELQGALAGGFSGVLMGVAICRQNPQKRAVCAAIGLVIGASIGYSVAKRIKEIKQKYASLEQAIPDQIRRLNRLVPQSVALNDKLAQRIRFNQQHLNQLKWLESQGRLNQSQRIVLQQVSQVKSKIASGAQEELKNLEIELQTQQRLYNECVQTQNGCYRQQNWQYRIVQLKQVRDQWVAILVEAN